MRAVVYHNRMDVRYEDVPETRSLGEREVRVLVRYAGICHTDYNEYRHGPFFIPTSPHPRTGRSAPLIMGHEFSGKVIETGPGVRRVRIGDRVAVNSVDSCGDCVQCRRGAEALCNSAAYIGFSRDGGFAQQAIVPEVCCYSLTPEVSDRAGALVEPFAVAVHAVRQCRPSIGARVAIVGGGAVGLCTLQTLLACGVRNVFVFETCGVKRKLAARLGASKTIDAADIDGMKVVRDLTDGLGVDCAFECVGAAAALETAVRATRAGGRICIVGIYPGPFEFEFNRLVTQEKAVITSLAYGDEFPTVIAMLADGRLRAEPLVTRTVPLSESLAALAAYEKLAASTIRTLIEVNGGRPSQRFAPRTGS